MSKLDLFTVLML